MAELIIPGGDSDNGKDAEEITINYEPTQEDEENFFLMYHFHWTPETIKALDVDYKRWIIGRFMAQKNMEREMMIRHKMMNEIGPNLKI